MLQQAQVTRRLGHFYEYQSHTKHKAQRLEVADVYKRYANMENTAENTRTRQMHTVKKNQ